MWLLTLWGGVKRLFGLAVAYPWQAALIIALAFPKLPSTNSFYRAWGNSKSITYRLASGRRLGFAYGLHLAQRQFRLPMPFPKWTGSVKQSIGGVFLWGGPSKVTGIYATLKAIAAIMRSLMNACWRWAVYQCANLPAHINRFVALVHLRTRLRYKREGPHQAIASTVEQNDIPKIVAFRILGGNHADRGAIPRNPFVVHIAQPGRFYLYRIAAIFNPAYNAVIHSEVSFRGGQGRRLLKQLIRPVFYGRFSLCSQGPLSC